MHLSPTYYSQVVFSFVTIFWSVSKLLKFRRHYFLGYIFLTINIMLSLPFVVSVFFKRDHLLPNLYVPSFLRVWSSYKLLVQIFALTNKEDGYVSRVLFRNANVLLIVYIIVCFLIIGTCTFRFTANCFEQKPLHPYSFVTCLYFMIVTLSSVGFGDITPFNAMSRMFITSYIILGIVLLPQLINELITSVAEKKRIYKEYESGLISNTSHIILVGDLQYTNTCPFIAYAKFYLENGTFRFLIPKVRCRMLYSVRIFNDFPPPPFRL
ncbi:potassium channel subfamily T member 1-like [Zophobas morio]|uniref:potassium channel subfamily T member 1-like n=1 Tax=Zophobas morio TaxID=2755281 RepID=UPI0030837C87